MQIEETALPGCLEIRPRRFTDSRGSFVKSYHQHDFEDAGLCTHFPEAFYSKSRPRVVRGLHFMLPPEDHYKLVYCVHGSVLDVVLDLRLGSPTYGQHTMVELNEMCGNMLYLAPGLAHGFCAPDTEAILAYRVSTVHSPAHDAGIRWDSAGISWPVRSPIISDRDRNLPTLEEFQSPFIFAPALESVR